ncbi:MAG: hypothetical protein PVI27_11595, partial [Desulfobacteraceae bacterium]
QLIKRIIWIEIIGFSSIILLIWLDELLDLPYLLFGAMATPFNYSESIFESVVIMILAYIIVSLTHTILRRLEFFEDILPICSFCKKIRSESDWIPIEKYFRSHSKADFSHSVCPECAEEYYGGILGEKQNR